MTRRALTLIEAAAAVAILAIAVPPSVAMLADAARHRAGSAGAERAMWVAGAVLETIAADVASADPDLGFDALADSAAYIDGAVDGLRARLTDLETFADAAGIEFDITIGPLVGHEGTVTGSDDRFRIVSVDASWPGARGAQSLTLSRMVRAR
ncbi:MAG: hypothetical protein ACF8QF_03145 [Phycisphaerales bacterium]